VELVRKLELSGCGVVEVGVRHYPRLHGRSQFFRVKSLAVTLTQLVLLWFRLVPGLWLAPAPVVEAPAPLPSNAPVLK